MAPNIAFPDEAQYVAIVDDARSLAATIAAMLQEDKVSLPAMRDVLAKIEVVPVSFERDVALFQQKMLSAQTWLAKARKCIPKRRGSRRSGGTAEPKKMDLSAIRALVDDAPCDDSAEMFEMQDLLECADEWAEKVSRAIEGGSSSNEITLEELKELYDEGNDMPVDMAEQTFLEAEIAAREWCVKATAMLAANKPLRVLERLADDAKAIRVRLHAKKQARWKPQVERDIHAAIDTARRWVNEVRDVVGQSAFDKLLSSVSAAAATTATDHTSHAASASHQANDKAKKPLASIAKLLDKSEKLVVNVSAYVDALKALQGSGYALRDDVRALLIGIGCLPQDASDDASAAPPKAPEAATDSVNSNNASESTSAAAIESDSTEASTSADKSASGAEPAAAVDFSNFAHATALLERVFALPFQFDEGSALETVIAAEKDWAQRVRDALPPRQSRKKRQAKHPVTLELLEQLLLESKELRFRFPDELKVLVKELEDLGAWQRKARDVIETPVAEHIAALVPKLRDHDLAVYRKLQAAKQALADARSGTSAASTSSGSEDTPVTTTAMETDASSVGTVVAKTESTVEDVEMADASSDAQAPVATESVKANGVVDASASSAPAAVAPVAAALANSDVKPLATTAPVLVPIDAVAILSHLRLESGCMQRQPTTDDAKADDAIDTTNDTGEASASARDTTVSLLEPVLTLAEKSLDDIAALEARDERVNVLETLELVSGDVDSAFTDDAVKTLETWRDQIAQVVDDGELLSAVAPELESLATVVDLLAWLQSARSLFYDEMLPLRELVAQGKALALVLERLKTSVSTTTLATLECMLWPLPHLEAQDAIVERWTLRVRECIAAKRVSVATFARLLDDGASLLMEPDAFKVLHDEVKRAKAWLAKLKKRVKALITKRVMRLSMAVARSFVDDGDDVVLETPVFDLLKDNVDVASDWETRVLASGIESGHARIATLVSLLNEYDCAGLLIDLDMHRDVLKSATERYCICRQPFDGLMIGCDFCDDWFHDNCIGMSKEKAEKVEHYTCPSCTILHDLSTALASVNNAQRELWDEVEYVKSFDKQHGVFARKLKREEKAVEKSEHQVASCSSQMNQLRVAIDELERRKGAAAVKSAGDAKVESVASRVEKTAAAPTSTGAVPATAAAAVEAPHQPPQPQQQPAPATTAPTIAPVVKTESSSATAAGAPAAAPTEAPASASTQSGDVKAVTTPATTAPAEAAGPTAPVTATSTPSAKTEPKASAGLKTAPSTAATAVVTPGGGDMTEQLTKMRNAHAELMLQLHDAQESLRLSKVRLQIAQDGLKELRTSHDARKRGLQLAQSWVCRAVTALNTTSLLSRAALLRDGYVPDAYAALLSEVTLDAPDPAHWTAHIDTIFPEVRAYARLLRLVGWSLVVVSLLQERPSREMLSHAIAYATAHSLWDGKTVGPLKGVLGRMDAWIAKVHKSVAKTGLSKSQKVPRLKLFLNEYSKLPLTCTPLAEALEAYIAAAEATAGAGQSAEQVKQTYDATESAVLAAFTDAAAALTAAPTTVGAIGGSGAAATASAQSKAPRKRKPYVRREKPLSAKKLKKSASSSEATSDSVETHPTEATE